MTDFLDRVGCFFLGILATLLRAIPFRLAAGFGRFAGFCFFLFSNRRRVAYADLKAALGNQLTEKQRWQTVRRHYENHGQMFIEMLCFPNLTREMIDKNIVVNNMERFTHAVEQDHGVVLLTAHFGNWELLQIISGLLEKPVHVLARNQKHSRLDQFLNQLRESHGSVSIKRGMGVRELLKCLRRGDLIGVLGDQDAGRDQGLIVKFLGRKTTIPTGAFELAGRTDSPVLPCFINRKKSVEHEIDVCEPIDCSQIKKGGETELRQVVQKYVDLLENFIKKYPSEWLWESKRWKYTWTKRILILSDGKPGHVKQSKAVASQFQQIEKQYGRDGMEYPTETIEVEFKSKRHRHLFAWLAFLMMPWIQGRLRWLKPFFTKESYQKIKDSSADFIISAGSSLVPLNLCLAKESRAKSIVLMKPSFPYNLFDYDLVIVPMHDQGRIPKREYRTLITPNQMNDAQIQDDLEVLKKELKDPERVKFSLFLGGSTRDFQMDYVMIEKLFSSLKKIVPQHGDYVVTTSRRTPDRITHFLKNTVQEDKACQKLIVATEDTRTGIASGMMALSDVLIVTEDSVSMISEAISSGKKVIVIDLETNKLPAKHQRFKEMVVEKAGIVTAKPGELEKAYHLIKEKPASSIFETESLAMRGQLQEIL